ncbi:hypothetical protein HPB50_002166 [Hyalomma asiaticum]|uniref:Uncharacterized protein n=1 Tax=Hyalomma asiaticum TaxID=266040 RepID=A0ACB7RSQ9_HYAAI|nr:hypothetical protein HPB50_002166 [Hyalomma asiaticum]
MAAPGPPCTPRAGTCPPPVDNSASSETEGQATKRSFPQSAPGPERALHLTASPRDASLRGNPPTPPLRGDVRNASVRARCAVKEEMASWADGSATDFTDFLNRASHFAFGEVYRYSPAVRIVRDAVNPMELYNEDFAFRYNKSQIKTRNSVERTFGVWKRRFACLRVKLLTDTDRSAAIVTACAVLHNIACLRWGPCPISDEVDPDVDLPDNPSQGDPDTVAGAQVRSCYIRRCFSSGNEHTGPVQT